MSGRGKQPPAGGSAALLEHTLSRRGGHDRLHSTGLTGSGAHTGQPREPSLCRRSAFKADRLSAVGCVLGFPSAVLRGSARGAPAQVCVVVWSPTCCDQVPPDTSPQIHACCRPVGAAGVSVIGTV